MGIAGVIKKMATIWCAQDKILILATVSICIAAVGAAGCAMQPEIENNLTISSTGSEKSLIEQARLLPEKRAENDGAPALLVQDKTIGQESNENNLQKTDASEDAVPLALNEPTEVTKGSESRIDANKESIYDTSSGRATKDHKKHGLRDISVFSDRSNASKSQEEKIQSLHPKRETHSEGKNQPSEDSLDEVQVEVSGARGVKVRVKVAVDVEIDG